jgi:magnesium transporter
MIGTIMLDTRTRKFSRVKEASHIDQICAQEQNVVWVDIVDPSEEDFKLLSEEFKFHPLALEDCRTTHQRPKVEEYKGYYFIVLYEVALVGPEKGLELRELNIFLGPNYLVTVHSRPLRTIDTAARLWPEWIDRAEAGSGLLAYLLIDAIVDDYMPLLDGMSERMDDLEDQIFGDFQPEAIQDIFLVKKQLLLLRRSVAPLRDVFNTLLRREQPIFPREVHRYFQDVFDHLIRVTEQIDTLRDLLGATMDAYLSVSGNRMNVVMKRLTSISTILMSVTLIAGIYGMNFERMPELKMRYGYVGALSSMVVIGVAIFLYFRKIRWL